MGAPLLAAAIPAVTSIIADLVGNMSEGDKAKAAIAMKQLEMLEAQAEVNKEEAKHTNLFVSGWRPFIGWVCGMALVYQFLARPMLVWYSALTLAGWPIPPDLEAGLWELVFAMLGLGGLRSFEKHRGVS